MTDKHNSRNGALFALGASVFVLLVWAVYTLPTMTRAAKSRANAETIYELSEVLEERWRDNGYAPSQREVACWLVWIQTQDINERGLLWWAGFIDRESLGNPTSRPKCDSGQSRGTGSVKLGALEDHCIRAKRKMPARPGVALYNPLFNIKVMITEVEFYCDGYASTALGKPYGTVKNADDFPMAWACVAYNSGCGEAERLRRRGVNPRFTFYRDVLERQAQIEEEVNRKRRR